MVKPLKIWKTRVNLGLDLSLKLQQKLSFQMIQSLKLLQVNSLQLEQMLKTEMEMNPVLEIAEADEIEQLEDDRINESGEEGELEVAEDDIDLEDYLEDGFDLGYSRTDSGEQSDKYESNQVYEKTLEEHLMVQLDEKKLSEKRRLEVEFIIGSLESDGYLRISLEDVAEYIDTDIEEAEEALNVIWNMDPAGVGARTLQECLMLQLRRQGLERSIVMEIIRDYWPLFEAMKIPDIAKKIKLSASEVESELELIKKLNPKPGGALGSDNTKTIIPDIIVEKVDGRYIATLNDNSMPTLFVNKSYRDMLRRGSNVDKDVKKYVREKFDGAKWLINSIEQRKATMLKVIYAIIERQVDFFELGPPNLNPLKQQDVADMIEMHISTVSRVVNGKFVQTMHGIYEMKYFFTEALGQNSEGEDISTSKIKNRLKELVDAESKKKPLSDQKLSEMLTADGFKVARRTVAKYREQAKILPARLRKSYS